MVTGVAVGTTGAEFVANISATNCSVKLLKDDGSEQTGAVGTGNKLVVYGMDGNPLAVYEVVIFGDLNGDGKINSADLLKIRQHLLGINTIK